jgi:hypothetical protein
MIDPMAYYSPETLLFPTAAQSFASTGTLDPVMLYLILDWKAPRARTRHRSRLAKIVGSFNVAANMIAAELYAATTPEQRLCLLLTKWGFRLPTASAILAILYPDTFTIYDIRVCNTLRAFHQLGNVKWSSNTWREYLRFVSAVRDAAPQGLSLRDCDRWLWGQNKQEALLKEIAEAG